MHEAPERAARGHDSGAPIAWRTASYIYNQRLSVRRADGVTGDAITVQGFGETHVLVPTGPNVREPQNRQGEIIIR